MNIIIYSAVILAANMAVAADAFLVVPDHLRSREGNSAGWPFTFQNASITSRRYQQVFDSSQFGFIQPAGGYIKELWFRADQYLTFGNAADFLDNVEISMGITARSPDSLSPLFSENIGGLYSTVYGPSPLLVETSIGWTKVSFSNPFLYNPADGHLLIDIRTTDTTEYPFAQRTLDAEETMGDSISSVFANDVNSPSGLVSTRGLVTQFRVEPVPEPSAWALMGLGICGMWCFLRRQNQR